MSKVKASKPSKTSDVLSKVKDAGVTKPAKSAKAASTAAAATVAKKVEKGAKKVKKAVSPPPAESESDSESDVSSDSESEEEAVKPVKSGKANGAKVAKKEESDSDSSEEESEDDAPPPKTNGAGKVQPKDDSDDSSDESESDDDKPAVSAVMGAKLPATAADEDSSGESDSDDEPAPKTNGAKANGTKISGKKADSSDEDSDDSDDSESDEEPTPKNGVKAAQEDDDDDDDDSSDDSSDEEETKPEPKQAKRKADDVPERATKKAKAEEQEANGGNLFIGNLSWNMTDDWLREEFGAYGEVTRVQIMTDRSTGRSKGFGYVEFVNAADAAKAHDELKGKELDGRELNVDYANQKPSDKQRFENRSKAYGDSASTPSETLFAGNLSFEADHDSITEAFSQYGTIQSIRLPTDRETEKPRGFGYITFSSVEEATAALEAMSGFYLNGRPIRLDYSPPRDNNNTDSPRGRGGFGGRGGGRGFGDRGGRGGRGGFGDRGGRGGGRGRGFGDRGGRGGRGGSTNRGGFGDFSGKKTSF